MDTLQEIRRSEVLELINTNLEIKKLYEDNSNYIAEISEYPFGKLINELQPKWSNQNFLSTDDQVKLTLLLLEYRKRGFDIEYFTSGAGSYIKKKPDSSECSIL
jgi:hypothetical protein